MKCLTHVLTITLLSLLPLPSLAGDGLIKRVIRYFDESNNPKPEKPFDVSFIGGPFYSSDVHFGIGLVAAGQYRLDRSDSLLQPSSVALKLQCSTTLFYSVAIEGMNIFPADRGRLNYRVEFKNLPTYFWGIGYEQGIDTDHKTKYRQRSFSIDIEGLARISGPLYLGPALTCSYTSAVDIHSPEYFLGLSRKISCLGIGAELVYDTRDVVTEPHSGWYIKAKQSFMPRSLGNTNHSFSRTDFMVCHYRGLWRGAILAARLSSVLTFGNTPWALMPTFGGSTAMRGYYEGQYRDKCEADLTVELRQRVWRRSGLTAWVGIGSVFPDFKGLRWNRLLPNGGIGYRWEFKKRVNVRLDLGFGKKCYGIEFNINEAF